MVVVNSENGAHAARMSEQRILELEALLATANAALEVSTQANAKLKDELAAAELSNKRNRRNSRSAEASLQTQLSAAQRGGKW
jgi:hypothetical protein